MNIITPTDMSLLIHALSDKDSLYLLQDIIRNYIIVYVVYLVFHLLFNINLVTFLYSFIFMCVCYKFIPKGY